MLSENHTWEVGTYQDDDGDDIRNENDPDIDGDGWSNITEGTQCHDTEVKLNPYYHNIERIDGQFRTVDDDGDGLTDEALPSGTGSANCDGDQFTGALENFIFSTTSYVDDQADCAETSIANDEPDRWPLDFNDNKFLNTQDLTGFASRLGSAAPGPPYDVRWDLNGNGVINSGDLTLYATLMGTFCSPG